MKSKTLKPTTTPREPPAVSFGAGGAAKNLHERSALGIKVKLFLAFCAMAGLTITAAAIAWYAFVAIERSVDRITVESVPAMAVSLRLAEKSAEIAATAPALIASINQEARVATQAGLEARSREIAGLMEDLKATQIEPGRLETLAEIQQEITGRLSALNTAVEERLRLKSQRDFLSNEMVTVHGRFADLLEPLVDDAVFSLIISGEDLTAQSTEAVTGLVEGGVSTIHLLLIINAEANLAAGLLAEAANAPDPVLVQPIRESFFAAAATIERSLSRLPDIGDRDQLKQALDALLKLGSGNDNMFDIRERELRATEGGQETTPASGERMAETVKANHEALLAILTPMVDDATFELVVDAEDITAQSSQAITDLIDGGVTTLQVLLALQAEGNMVAGLLAEAANTSDRAMIQPVRERFIAAADHIQAQLDRLPDSMDGDELRDAAERLTAFGLGDDGIFGVRERELRQIATADDLLQTTRSLSTRLGEQVAELVTVAQSGSDQAALQASQAISNGELVLLLITAVSIAGAILVVLLYVAPRVVKPLENITSAMTELAAGDTTVDIPARERRDEIGRMAQALGVFRDTAIEVQKSNLKEIQETRGRLTYAIESISEGFTLFDSDDRLVLCNTKYREMLVPGVEEIVSPGVPFKTIVRHAAERGDPEDATGRIDDWVAERLAEHRAPGRPQLQQRSDGRWILVSEHKTEDGGTVAVYSDITELKQREEELSDKSGALEQLSNQLAKYLSPQVYESIFSGKQEVKLTSQRKKLTVFFSDIAGFTETADKLESEDLTRLLNEYLTEMSQIALSYGATIDKYVGDAIVIFFGDPETRGVNEDALACVEMAIAMRKKMGELQSVWRASGIENPLQVRIGINTGYCTVGNFGSEDRMDYTIIGGGVNLASRLESSATPGEILISYETYALVRDEIHCEERGQINVKGIAYPVATYVAIDSYDNLDRERQLIREDHPNLKLNLDLDTMSLDERSQAAAVLRRALDRLSAEDRGGKSERAAKKASARAKPTPSKTA
jgi:class 3 adenylate cyclase/phosphoglycerate-specific signal transduction histidine kinase